MVTGSSGFIGRRLIETLRESGLESVPVSRQSGHDLCDPAWTKALPGCDAIVHLAQSRQFRTFPDGASDMFTVNVVATATLLEWARQHGVKLFILASTGSVYRNASTPYREGDACKPADYYSATKMAAELLCEQYSECFRSVALRLFTVYGPGQSGRLVPTIVQRVANGEPVELADGTGPHLNPLHVDDAVEMILCILRRPESIVGGGFDVFNVAGVEALTVRDVVGMISRLLGIDAVIIPGPGSPRYVLADISKFVATFGYTPRIPFRHGLQSVISVGGEGVDRL